MLLPFSPAPNRKPADPRDSKGSFARVVARRYHLHAPGIVYTIISVLIVLGAINGQNNLLFWAFGLAVSGMLISGIVSGAVLMGVQVRREPLFTTDAGSPLLVRYTVRNKNRFVPSFALTIEELESPKRRRRTQANWFELMPRPVAFVPHVPPKGVVSVDAAVTPWTRGRARFEALRVSTTFPFGLTFKSVVLVQPQETIVRPWRPPLLPGAMRRLLNASGHSERSVQRRGVGEETFALRDYRSGESVRQVVWKPTARHGRLIVRETAQRSPASICLAVGSATSPAAKERVISMVAALASIAAGDGLEVGMLWEEAGISLAPSTSSGAGGRVLDALALGRENRTYADALPLAAFDRSTKVIVQEFASSTSAATGLLAISVDDPFLSDAKTWAGMPKSPDDTVDPGSRRSPWQRFLHLLGGLG